MPTEAVSMLSLRTWFALALAALLTGFAAPPMYSAPAKTSATSSSTVPVAEQVVFNTKSLKYHCRTCSAAKRCTRNCVTTTLRDAKARGGVACKLCGGTCKD